MQFFHLFSFAVVASYAAAFPQPAELSKRYSNNIDVDLASGLEARSYQPGFNSQGDSATLVSLERRRNYGGSSGGSGGSGTPSPPSPVDIQKILDDAFKRGDFSSANISSTIYKVGDGMVHLYKDGPKAGATVGGSAGDMLAKYIKRVDYVDTALIRWMEIEFSNIIDAIKLAMGEVEFSKIAKDFFITLAALGTEVTENENKAVIAISNIVKHINTPIQNVETMNTLFELALNIRMQLVNKLRSRLEGSESAKVLYGYLSNLVASIMKFIIDQQGLYVEIIKALEAPPPK
ncbi:hypothetical protein BASA50_000917 [Batrachochytrium salamandrivorans]|uniref:Uncharacterized protein n=1 Tax=Batrachochytrium salamandrivorans TaxID=1357716 RepID=A0ABQ8EVL1_9FUNG|nr:hypothetical protein BASA62_006216 [Batrachochytrium salamandrivorans]KAH6585974.1 hypothetical protein BASA50_000917 [Batrachochytrium salamandrivorans]KAH9248285.1 hypothetical protein BASA81_014089 [Batrachochytrium salamandrivorans]KAH9275652.1 hypothetical protein BASA83_001950 [Batrachochytrium salamandrivorans]